jgi:hypothetical protein
MSAHNLHSGSIAFKELLINVLFKTPLDGAAVDLSTSDPETLSGYKRVSGC